LTSCQVRDLFPVLSLRHLSTKTGAPASTRLTSETYPVIREHSDNDQKYGHY